MSMRVNAKGQMILTFLLVLGVSLAGLIMVSFDRQRNLNNKMSQLDASQAAQEVLGSAAKKVQQIYSGEAGCDPTQLDSLLNGLSSIAANATFQTAGGSTIANGLVIAEPKIASGSASRYNLCTGTGTPAVGCRQVAIPLDNLIYVVTFGYIAADPLSGSYLSCPRDATIRMSVTILGSVFRRRATLINTCTTMSSVCATVSPVTMAQALLDWTPIATFHTPTPAPIVYDATVLPKTTACASSSFNQQYHYGSFFDNATISADDVRWARRYLETGRGNTGDTSYANFSVAPSSDNGACPYGTLAASQCAGVPCIPHFDLNLDRVNNEADLAILEYYFRGFLPVLPVTFLR